MQTQLACPTEEELIAFSAGLVAEEDESRLGEHLDHCATCCQVMETAHGHDAITAALRRPLPQPALAEAFSPAAASKPPSEATHAAPNPSASFALGIDRFTGLLTDLGILTANELAVFWAAIPEAARPGDALELGRMLVRAGKLTAYQAQTIVTGKGSSLQLGNYLILDKLGQGGMGVVFKAIHRRLKRLVALKVLSPRFSTRPEFVQRFQREVEAAAKLSHPHIVKAFDAELTGARRFLVMEYVQGTDLASLVKRLGPMPARAAVDCVLQAARGLEFVHAQGIVHRDIKPSNLLRDQTGTVKLLDLGLARMASADSGLFDLTTTGAVMGTADYMAPEQASDGKRIDERVDIYSLGMTLWFLLLGRPTFPGGNVMAKMLAHRESPAPSLSQALPDLPRQLDALFQKMVAKRPEDRYGSIAEVIQELERCCTVIPESDADVAYFARLERFRGATPDADRIDVAMLSGDPCLARFSDASTVSLKSLPDEEDTHPRVGDSDRSWTAGGIPTAAKRASTGNGRTKWWIGGATMLAVIGIVALVLSPLNPLRSRITQRPPPDPAASVPASAAAGSAAGVAPSNERTAPSQPGAARMDHQSKTLPPTEPPANLSAAEQLVTAREQLATLNQELLVHPDNAQALGARIGLHKQLGMWTAATSDAGRLADVHPEQSILRMQVAYLALTAGDHETYRATCDYLLQHFGDSAQVDDLERVCKAPLFAAGLFEVSSLPVKHFESLIRVDGPDTGPMHWACATRAYVACRAGDPAAALDWLNKRPAPESAKHLCTYRRFIEAQALHLAGRQTEAHDMLAAATATIPSELVADFASAEPGNGPFPAEAVHGDWLILNIIRRQTEQLLGGGPAEPAGAKQ